MATRHCADEHLLAYLDGELGWMVRERVKRHLARCWHCRTRLAGLEEQVHDLIRRVDDVPMPPERIRAARERFFGRGDVQSVPFSGDTPQMFVAVPRRLIPVGIALAVSVSGLAFWHMTSPTKPLPPVEPAATIRVSAPPTPSAAVRPDDPVPGPSMARIPEPVVQPPAVPAIDLAAVELHVLLALHRARACLGEGIEVVRTGQEEILVQGVVQSENRRNQVTTALRPFLGNGLVRLRLKTADEVPIPNIESLPPVGIEGGSSCTVPMEPRLLQWGERVHPEMSAEARARHGIDVSNQVLHLASAALSHAWALSNFAGHYPQQKMDHLAEPERVLAHEVVEDHSSDLRSACSKLTALLDGIVEPDAGPAAALQFSSWQGAASGWLELLRGIHSDASELFSCGRGVEEPQALARRMMRQLSEIRSTSVSE